MQKVKRKEKKCCNPFQNHSRRRDNLLPIGKVFRKRFSAILPEGEDFICSTCKARCYDTIRKNVTTKDVDNKFDLAEDTKQDYVHQEISHQNIAEEAIEVKYEDDSDMSIVTSDNKENFNQGEIFDTSFEEDESFRKQRIVFEINKLFHEMEIPPINFSLDSFVPERMESKINSLAEKLKNYLVSNYKPDSSAEELENLIALLSQKYQNLENVEDKIHLLTVLPTSWDTCRMATEMKCSTYLAGRAKLLQEEQGVFSRPDSTRGSQGLSEETIALVKAFYCSDEISRILPGKIDFVTVREDGLKRQLQKRFILGNLTELYASFKEEYPDLKIGFSKFAQLRPEQCILVGPKGIHTVCVCQIHQNVILMISGAKLNKLAEPSDECPFTYQEMLQKIICSPPSEDCHFNKCEKCPKFETVGRILRNVFEKNGVQEIQFNEWITIDHCHLQLVSYTVDSYIDVLEKRLTTLKTHSFIAKSQATFLEESKKNLKANEFIVLLNFSENYCTIIQDEIQGHHWNKEQTTVHPYVIYSKQNEIVEHENFVVISDCLNHDASTVYFFQTKLINYLKTKYGAGIKKIQYFSDGAASQYKNISNFINLLHHKLDFDIDAEWHFFATSHGKSPCDAVGGTVKRLATRSSLQSPKENQILSSQQLYEWAINSELKMTFEYCLSEDIKKLQENLLNVRFSEIKTIPGIHSYNAFLPEIPSIKIKLVSISENYEVRNIINIKKEYGRKRRKL